MPQAILTGSVIRIRRVALPGPLVIARVGSWNSTTSRRVGLRSDTGWSTSTLSIAIGDEAATRSENPLASPEGSRMKAILVALVILGALAFVSVATRRPSLPTSIHL
jgi:hypothetical protein